jgi:hypothetical protein
MRRYIPALILIGCSVVMVVSDCNKSSHTVKRGQGFNPAPAIPCYDAGLATDPNNCGACGTKCGTYVRNPGTGGVSYQLGTCAYSTCAPYTINLAVDGGIFDCFDDLNGSVYAGGLCISILRDANNCGGLGYKCLGACLSGQCNGTLTVPSALTYTTPTDAFAGQGYTTYASGGAGPYTYSFALNGNLSGGSINASSGYYTAGNTYNVTDTLKVTDSNQNVTIGIVPVTHLTVGDGGGDRFRYDLRDKTHTPN